MNNREAIEILREKIVPCVKHSAWDEAIDMAISALEKQEGKKPIAVNAKSTWVKCPVCGSTDIDEYCEKCGQKILWEE